MFRIVPKDINIDFIGKMRPAYVVSGVLVAASLFMLYGGHLVGRGCRADWRNRGRLQL